MERRHRDRSMLLRSSVKCWDQRRDWGRKLDYYILRIKKGQFNPKSKVHIFPLHSVARFRRSEICSEVTKTDPSAWIARSTRRGGKYVGSVLGG